jgi:sec-independent protein translocase protein TatA
MFGGLGMWEIMLIFLVVLLLFGAKRLPEIGSSLGKGIREFKSSIREIEGELKIPDEKPRVTRAPEPRTQDEPEEGADGEPRRLTTSQ